MFIFAIKKGLICELFNASLYRNRVGITIQRFLQDFFLNYLTVPNLSPEARCFQAGQGGESGESISLS